MNIYCQSASCCMPGQGMMGTQAKEQQPLKFSPSLMMRMPPAHLWTPLAISRIILTVALVVLGLHSGAF